MSIKRAWAMVLASMLILPITTSSESPLPDFPIEPDAVDCSGVCAAAFRGFFPDGKTFFLGSVAGFPPGKLIVKFTSNPFGDGPGEDFVILTGPFFTVADGVGLVKIDFFQGATRVGPPLITTLTASSVFAFDLPRDNIRADTIKVTNRSEGGDIEIMFLGLDEESIVFPPAPPEEPKPPIKLPDFDSCTLAQQPDDPVAMNTIHSRNTAKTIHAEKQIFTCQLEQGNIPVTVDVMIIAEIYQQIGGSIVHSRQAHVITCMKTSHTLIGCVTEVPSTDLAPVRNCTEESIAHPQEMNTVNSGRFAKTIEAQKEVFRCDFGNIDASDDKKVDLVVFTKIVGDLSKLRSNPVKAFESFRCVTSIDTAKVESCKFT